MPAVTRGFALKRIDLHRLIGGDAYGNAFSGFSRKMTFVMSFPCKTRSISSAVKTMPAG